MSDKEFPQARGYRAMVFELHPGADLTDELRRLSREQIGKAVKHLSNLPQEETGVHEARKCLKRTRSLLQLARPALPRGKARKLDRRAIRIARSLSGTRDCQAMIEALDGLEKHFGKGWSPAIADGLRAMFQGRLQRGTASAHVSDKDTIRELKKLRSKFAKLRLTEGSDALGAGIERTYARAQRRFEKAYELGEGTAFHNWRKEAQRHWRQMQLLVAAWPEAMAVRVDRARELSQCLGDDHDLYILLGHVRNAAPDLAPWRDLERFYDGCIERQLAMRMAARNHGKLLFAEDPGAFRQRMMRYWQAAGERYAQGMPVTETVAHGRGSDTGDIVVELMPPASAKKITSATAK